MTGESPRGLFITGTDTGVGKTVVTCALLAAYARAGRRAVGMKPVAAGADRLEGRLVNEDVSSMIEASNVAAPAHLVNPYCFEPPIAPHIAATAIGVTIEIERIAAAYRELATLADRVVVEGAGGFRVPLGATTDTADLARELQLPVVLVVGMRLGCINHALLTVQSIASAGLRLAGWVANHIDAHMLHAEENVGTLSERITAPMIARIPYMPHSNPTDLARYIDPEFVGPTDAGLLNSAMQERAAHLQNCIASLGYDKFRGF